MIAIQVQRTHELIAIVFAALLIVVGIFRLNLKQSVDLRLLVENRLFSVRYVGSCQYGIKRQDCSARILARSILTLGQRRSILMSGQQLG